jgi:hypothetical protein
MDIFDIILSRNEFISNPPILVDIGASSEIVKEWMKIAKYSICIAFDADKREMQYIEKEKRFKKLIVIDSIVTDKNSKEQDFYLTTSPYCSSSLEPDLISLENWSFYELFTIQKKIKLKAITLPKVLQDLKIKKIDWFKSDSQGVDLRIFTSLGKDIIHKVLVAEFEPGILDSYKREDKLCKLMIFMEGMPFWVSNMIIRGAERVNKNFVFKEFDNEYRNYLNFGNSILNISPGWSEICYLNNFDNDNNFNIRDYLLMWIFAIIKEQYGFAMEIAIKGGDRFSDKIFRSLKDCLCTIIERKIFEKRKIDKINGSLIFRLFKRMEKLLMRYLIG